MMNSSTDGQIQQTTSRSQKNKFDLKNKIDFYSTDTPQPQASTDGQIQSGTLYEKIDLENPTSALKNKIDFSSSNIPQPQASTDGQMRNGILYDKIDLENPNIPQPQASTDGQIQKKNIHTKKAFKEISPLYNKMEMKCDVCNKPVAETLTNHYKYVEGNYCGTCIVKAKCSGYWATCPKTGRKILIPIINKPKKICDTTKSSIMDGFLKFQLLEYSKNPSSEWQVAREGKDWSKKKTITNNCGVGIPTGKVNGITVIDLDDYKWNDDHEFIKTFGRDYKKFGTYTQKSAKGGVHLFFQYEDDIPNAQVKEHLAGEGIDILNDINKSGKHANAYVVGAGTTVRFSQEHKEKYNLKGDFGTYTIFQDKPIIKMPTELKEWILENCYDKEDGTKPKTKKARVIKDIQVSNEKGYYAYFNLSNAKIREICEKLYKKEPRYYTDYIVEKQWGWLIFTTAMKSIGAYDIWDEYSKKYGGDTYNKQRNIEAWNGLTKFNEFNCLNNILLQVEERTLLDYTKYKPCYNPDIEFDEVGEWDKLGKHIKLARTEDYAIMSGTGTGKTTIVKKQILNTSKFISIVSRRSLAYEQYKVFNKDGINCLWYETYEGEFIPEHESVVIQIDSIMKLAHYTENIGNYTIFLDEYSSLIEHLVRSPTLGGKRALVFKIFTKLIKKCKQVLCVDADLNRYTMDFMDFCGRKLKKIKNTYNHNQGVSCEEYGDIEEIITKMKTKDKFLCCVDSARLGKSIVEQHFNSVSIEHYDEKTIIVEGKQMNKYEMAVFQDEKGFIVYISAENDYIPDLDEWDRVIFSPKIVYGLDSTMKRDVFGIFKEHTISPRSMLQQIARCRDITKLHYIFFRKSFKAPKYLDINAVKEANRRMDEMALWTEICDKESCDLFMNTLSIMEYNEDAQNTNKFVHFKKLLEDRGFIHTNKSVFQTKKGEVATMEKITRDAELENFDTNKMKYQQIGQLLNLPEDKWEDYADLFVNQASLQHYFNAQTFMTKSLLQIEDTLQAKQEFKVLKVRTEDFKIITLNKFQQVCGCQDKLDTKATIELSKEDAELWNDKIMKTFRLRLKETLDLTKLEDCRTIIEKCYKQLYGGSIKKRYFPTEAQKKANKDIMKFTKIDLFKKSRKQVDKVRITTNVVNKKYWEEIYNLLNYRFPQLVPFEEWKFGFNDGRVENTKIDMSMMEALDNGI